LRTLGAEVECWNTWVKSDNYRPLEGSTLVIAATDSFAAQATVNRFALVSRTPALFVGLAPRGLGGEVVFWYAGLPCFRCLVGKRYRAGKAAAKGARTDPPSHGCTVFDLDWVDSVAGHVALALLLRGTATRFGRLLERLGDRNYLPLKIDPDYRQSGRDR